MMTSHDFTLILDREPNDDEYDTLFEAGLDDAGIEAGGGQSLAHVIRTADTLGEAILSAVRQLETAGFTVTAIESEDLVTLKDIAARVDRTYESVRRLASGARGPGGFPPPMSASGWSLYSWSQVADWFRKSNLATVEVDSFERQMAIADHLIRARSMLSDSPDRADMARLVET